MSDKNPTGRRMTGGELLMYTSMAINAAVAAERERCAKIADKLRDVNLRIGYSPADAEEIVAKIRSGE